MKRRHRFYAVIVATFCAMANLSVVEAQVKVVVDRAFVAIDLDSVEVLLPPEWGILNNTASGMVYHADSDGTDSFVFVAEHAFLGVPVTFFGEVLDGVIQLDYQYSATDDEETEGSATGTGNPDGTVTVDDVTGTILQEPGTTIDFPEGTLVIGTDNSVSNDIGIIDSGEGSEIHTHDNVSTLDEVRNIFESYPDGSLPAAVLVGHGAAGGVQLSGNDGDLDGGTLADPANQDLVDLINLKLEEDAKIYILGCSQFDADDAQHIQNLATDTGHPVVSNEENVTFYDNNFWWDTFIGQGNWVEVTPIEEVLPPAEEVLPPDEEVLPPIEEVLPPAEEPTP